MDADDRLCEDFFYKTIDLLDLDKDLYIFSIKRYEDDKVIDWQIDDKNYDSNHEFADNYIKTRKALIYPNWNKFYKSSIIRDNNIKFDESIEFGEDRLFNYDYLRHCETIVTSSIFKNEYIKRTDNSLSTKYHKDFFNMAIKLHKEKMKCFIDLSNNAPIDEIKNFVGYDITNEIDKAIDRFDDNKQEEIENIGLINSACFEDPDIVDNNIRLFIILGSNNCGYKVEKALKLCTDKANTHFIVSGGNMHMNKKQTEAEFMADMLINNDVPKENVHMENISINTYENFKYSFEMIEDLFKNDDLIKYKKIGVITSAFHLKRSKTIVKKYFSSYLDDCLFYRAFGPKVKLDTWYKTEEGKKIVYNEIRKNIYEDYDDYKKFIYS